MSSAPRRPALLVLFGASGAGKTAAAQGVAARALPGVQVHHFDAIGVPAPEVMVREFGSGEGWQEDATRRWIARIARNVDQVPIHLLEGQTRPSFLRDAIGAEGIAHSRLVLLDCNAEVRRVRLSGPRGQPELASERMEEWAKYLRREAAAANAMIIDTSTRSPDEVVALVLREVDLLRLSAEALP